MSLTMISYLAVFLIPVMAGIVGYFKQRKKHKNEIDSKNKEIGYLDKRIDWYQKNRQAYQSVVEKLMEKKKNAIKLREKIDSSDSSDIADILNEL